MDGSVQATQRTTQKNTSLHLLFLIERVSKQITGNSFVRITKMEKKRCRDVVICVVLRVIYTLPSLCLVCEVFGTAIPISLYILENVFHTCSIEK